MRLIDADVLFKAFERAAWYSNMDRDEIAEEILLQMPTIDAVEVVRCKECKHRDAIFVCAQFDAEVGANHFCSLGERRAE